MNRARNLAAVLLFITGGLHVLSLLGNLPVAVAVINAVFGVAYLLLGYFLLRANQRAVYITAGLTVIGLLLSGAGLAQSFSWLTLVFFLFDVVILGCALIVIARMRSHHAQTA